MTDRQPPHSPTCRGCCPPVKRAAPTAACPEAARREVWGFGAVGGPLWAKPNGVGYTNRISVLKQSLAAKEVSCAAQIFRLGHESVDRAWVVSVEGGKNPSDQKQLKILRKFWKYVSSCNFKKCVCCENTAFFCQLSPDFVVRARLLSVGAKFHQT